jgi:hypothetical protein
MGPTARVHARNWVIQNRPRLAHVLRVTIEATATTIAASEPTNRSKTIVLPTHKFDRKPGSTPKTKHVNTHKPNEMNSSVTCQGVLSGGGGGSGRGGTTSPSGSQVGLSYGLVNGSLDQRSRWPVPGPAIPDRLEPAVDCTRCKRNCSQEKPVVCRTITACGSPRK